MKYVCNVCGSENIQLRSWVKANTQEFVDWCNEDGEECWCEECEEITQFEIKDDL